MIVLDTNVISEMVRPQPDARVLRWLTSLAPLAVFATAISQAEILYGVNLLPEGRRRDALFNAVQLIFDEDMTGRILPFDSESALHYADISARRRQIGQPMSSFDAQIAAVVRSRGATLATRNVRDFDRCGIEVIDPWAAV